MPEPSHRLRWAPIPATSLNIELSLTSGQVFRWTRNAGGAWLGAVGDIGAYIVPAERGFWWATYPPDRWNVVQAFFSLHVDVESLYREWVRSDRRFAELIDLFRGLRILRQPPESALCSFICSSCNNVPRISGMVSSLARLVARKLAVPWSEELRADPTLVDLARVQERALRDAGFGYRARYLAQLGRLARSELTPDMKGLERLGWSEARAALMALPGVGAKVADCVGLFAYGRHDVVPVDTHVRRYVVARFRPDLATRSLTPRVYDALAAEFRGIMGPYAGWAQQYAYMAARSGVAIASLQGGTG